MKRYMALLSMVAALLSLGVSLYADQVTTGILGKGVKFGYSLAKFHGSESTLDGGEGLAISPSFRSGVMVGGFVTVGLGQSIVLQPELFYSMKGTRYEAGGEKAIFKLDYLEFPVLFKFLIPTTGQLSPNLFLGPQVGILATRKLRLEASGLTVEGNIKNVNSTDAGIVFGGGVDMNVGQGKVIFEGRYSLNLLKLGGSQTGLGPDDLALKENVDLKNRAFGLLVGYSF